MTTITQDNITVQAETLAEAKKMLAKELWVEKKIRAKIDADREIAYGRAFETIGRLSFNIWQESRKDNPHLTSGYCFLDIATHTCPVTLTQREATTLGSLNYKYKVATEWGDGEIEVYKTPVTAVLENGAGFALVVKTEGESSVCWHAVGVHNGQLVWVECPTNLVAIFETMEVK